MMFDAAVIGTGPAGLAVAAACARAGLATALVGPGPDVPWRRSFAVWKGEVEAELCEAEWQRPLVWPCDGAPLVLTLPYARVNVGALQRASWRAAREASVVHVDATVSDVSHERHGSELSGPASPALRARVVVDASGPYTPFVERMPGPQAAYQAAYGEVVEVDAHPYAAGEMALMDYRPADDDERGAPSFLYAQPLGARRVFFEETSLAARPAVPLATLRRRLASRLARMRIQTGRVHEREWCLLPLGLPLPRLDQRTVAFGAAASFVHPSTGYQLARALRAAEPTARALAAGLAEGPRAAARRAYQAMWPRRERQCHVLQRYGMEVLLRLDRAGIADFFRAFFALPPERALAFLRGTASPAELARAMWGVYRAAPPTLRRELVRGGARSGGATRWHTAHAVTP